MPEIKNVHTIRWFGELEENASRVISLPPRDYDNNVTITVIVNITTLRKAEKTIKCKAGQSTAR
jgi:hypothetical protein